MKIFSIGLFLLLVFESLEGSTIPIKRSSRALNTSFITDFNGTYQRKDPSTNTEVESSTYKASHEFHHQSNDADWTDYTTKCSNIIKGFLQAITDLLASKCQQNSTFNFNINTTVSQNSDDCLLEGENGTKCLSPKITIQTTNYEIPSTNCQNYRVVNCIGEYRGGTNQEEVKKIQIRGRKYKCFPVCDEEKSEEIIKPKINEDEVCTEAPEQEKQESSQVLAETLEVEPTPSNPEFQQIPLTKTTEITEIDELISPKTQNVFVPSTTFTPSFDTFQSQTETVTDTETVENIKELPVEIFPTTSTYYDEELKESEKLVTQLPIKSFEISASPTPVKQIPTETSFEENVETVTKKTIEEIPSGDLSIAEIPVTIPPQPTTLSAAYTEEVVQTIYNQTPEPASQITISPVPVTQSLPISTAPLVTELNYPSQFETLNNSEVVLSSADQIAPENQSQTESVAEEIYEVETSTSQPASSVIVEAPLVIPQTESQVQPSEDQTLIQSTEETVTVQEPKIQEPLIIPEVQPDTVATTENLQTEIYEEKAVVTSQPEFIPEVQPVPTTENVETGIYEEESAVASEPQFIPEVQPVATTENLQTEVYEEQSAVTSQPQFIPEVQPETLATTENLETEIYEEQSAVTSQPQFVPEVQPVATTENVETEVYEEESAVASEPQFIPEVQPVDTSENLQTEIYEEESAATSQPQFIPEVQPVPITENVETEVYEEDSAVTSKPQFIPEVQPVDTSENLQTEVYEEQYAVTSQPQFIPEVQPVATTENVETEIYEEQSAVTSQPQFIPEVQPIDTTENLQTEVYEEESAATSQPQFIPEVQPVDTTENVETEVYEEQSAVASEPQFVPEVQPVATTENVDAEVYEEESAVTSQPQFVPEVQPVDTTENLQTEVYEEEFATTSQPQFVPEVQPVPTTENLEREIYEEESAVTSQPQFIPEVQPVATTENVDAEVYEEESAITSQPQFIPEVQPVPTTENLERGIYEEESTVTLQPQFIPEVQPVATTENVDAEVYEEQSAVTSQPQFVPEVQPVDTTENLQTEVYEEKFAITSQPQFIPEVQPVATTENVETEVYEEESAVASQPQFIPEVQPVDTTENLQTEIYEEQSAFTSQPQFVPEVQPVDTTENVDTEIYEEESAVTSEPQFIPEVQPVATTENLQTEVYEKESAVASEPQFIPEVQPVDTTENVDTEIYEEEAAVTSEPQIIPEVQPVDTTDNLQTEVYEEEFAATSQPQFVPEVQPVDTIENLQTEVYEEESAAASQPEFIPEVQPVDTTENLEREIYEESTPTISSSVPETKTVQVEDNDYDYLQTEAFEEYSSTPLPVVEQGDSYQEKTVETVSLSPEVESLPESTLLATQATAPQETFKEEVVVSVENDEASSVTQPLPETTILPSFPSQKPYILTSNTSNESFSENVDLLEPENNVTVKPSTSSVSQTEVSEVFDNYQTSPSPDYDFYGQLSNANFQEVEADSLVTEADVKQNSQAKPEISIEASAVYIPEYHDADETTSNDTLTTLSSNVEETLNENLSTPIPVQSQSTSVNDQQFVSLKSKPQFIDSNQEFESNIFVPTTEQPDLVTKNVEIIEKDTVAEEYTTPAPSVQPIELLITPQPQPSETTFFEEEIIEAKTPYYDTASTTIAPAEIVTLTNQPQDEQSLSLSESNTEQKTVEEVQPSPVQSSVPEISSSTSDQTSYTPLVSEPVGEVVPEYPNQPLTLNEQVVATEYNDYSTFEPQVTENEYLYETQPSLELTQKVSTTQPPLIDEAQNEESLFENTSTSQTEYFTESPQFFTQPPETQVVVDSESQTLANESQVSEFAEEQDVTSSPSPQIPTISSSVIEENFSNVPETEPILPSVSDEFSTFNEYSDSEVSTITPEQSLNTFYDLSPELEEQKQKEVVVVSEAETKVPDEQPLESYEPEFPAEQTEISTVWPSYETQSQTENITNTQDVYESEFPTEQPEVSPVWPTYETQSQTENVAYSQDVVTEQYQPNDQQFEISTPYPEEQFEPVPITQSEESFEKEETLSQSQTETEAPVNYSATLSDQNTNQSQLDFSQDIISTQTPQVQHKPFVDFDEFTTPSPGITVYEDQPFSIQYQTSIGPQPVTETTDSFYEEDITTKYSSTISPQPIPIVYSEQKPSLIGPKTQNLSKETFISNESEISNPQEESTTSAIYNFTSAPSYNQETDYSYSETSSTTLAPEFDYYSEPFVPTLSPEEESTTPYEISVTKQAETFDQKPEILVKAPLPEVEEETQSLEKSTDNFSYTDDLEQDQVPVVPNTEKEIIDTYDQDFTTTTSYKSGTESTVNSQAEVVEEIDNLAYQPLTTTPSADIFVPTELPTESDSFEKEIQSQTVTTASQNTENLEAVPVEEAPYVVYPETSNNFELTQTSEIDDEQFTQSSSTLPPQVQYPLTDLESSSLLSDQLSQTNVEESFSNTFTTPGIPEEQPLETIPEQPCLDCENSDSEFIKSSSESSVVTQQTEASNYDVLATTSEPNIQTFQTKNQQEVETETFKQFSTTSQQFATTQPEIEIDIHFPSRTTQESVVNEAVESITTTAPQEQDITTSYLKEEQQSSTLVPETLNTENTESELSLDYLEQTPEIKTSVSESPKPSSEIFEQYSDVNNYSESTASSFQEIDSINTTPAPQEKPIPAYDETLLTVSPDSQTSFSNYEDENLSDDTLTQQTQLPELVTSPPLSQTTTSFQEDSTQQFISPLPESGVETEEPCSDCEPSNPVVTEGQTEILEKSDYEYEEIATNPPSLNEQNFVPLVTEKVEDKNVEISEKEFTQTTIPPFYDEALENQSSYVQEEVFESQDQFKSTPFSAENTPYVTVLPKTESQFSSSTEKVQLNEFSSTPLPPLYVPVSEESKLSNSQSAQEEQCENCEEKTYTEKPLDYIDQVYNNDYVTSESLATETTENTSVVPESRIVPSVELQPLTQKPELSSTAVYEELPQTVEKDTQEAFYSYDDLSTTTTPDQQLPDYDNQSFLEPEPLEEQKYPGHFQQFNVKNTVSDSLVTEKVTNEQPMIYDTTLSPESASESFQTVVQLNTSTFTPQPQETIFVNEPVYQPSLLPEQHQLSTEHLSTTSETLTTTIPKSNEEPSDDGEIDIVTTPPVVSNSQFTQNYDYNEEQSYAYSNPFITEKPEFKPEILVTETTPNMASQSQSVVNDEIVSTDTYFSPTSIVPPKELPSSQQTEKQFSEVYEEIATEKPPATFVPLPILYPVNSSQISTEQSLSSESQTVLSTSAPQSQPEVLFYDSETITTNKNFSSTPTPSQVLNEVPIVSPLPPQVIPETNVPVIPPTNKFVEVDEEVVTITKAPETLPGSFATVDVVTPTLPPQPKQVVEVDEEILISDKNQKPVKTVTSATANLETLPQNLPPNLLYFQEEIITTKTPPSSVPQTSIPLQPSTILPTTSQNLALPSLSQKFVEVDQEIITSKYPSTVTSSITPQPPTTPVVLDEKFVSQTLYSTPLRNETKTVEKEIIIGKPTVSQEQYVTSAIETLPPVVTTPAPVPLPKKFTEVDEEILVVNKQATPNIAPLLTSLPPTPLPQGVSEVDEEVIITNQPTPSQVQTSLPPFLQPTPSSLVPNKIDDQIILTNKQTPQTSSFDQSVTPAVTVLPPASEPKKFVEVDQEIIYTSKQPASQTTIPPFVQPLIPLETTLIPRPITNEFKEVDEEIIITSKPAESQGKTTTPSLTKAAPLVTTTLAPSSSTKKFMEVDEEIIVSGKQPVPTLSPFFIAPVPTPLTSEPSAKKFMEVDEEVIITNKPTTPQLLTTPSPVPPVVSSTSVPPTKKVVEFDEEFVIANNNPTSPTLLNYPGDLSQIQPTDIAFSSSTLKPQTQPEKVTYFNQEVFTTTGTPNTIPLQTDAYTPLQPIQPVVPQSQTIDYFEQQPQTNTFEAESPVVTSFPTVTNTPQEMYPNAGVSVAQVDTSSQQPISYDLVPEQTIPSSKPGEDSCSCCSGSSAPLLCPFNPALKGNMSAPSYYILVSKIPHPSGNGEQSFQVEKVFLGDGTPLNCTLTDKTFPTSQYKPIPIASSRPVTLQTTYDHS